MQRIVRAFTNSDNAFATPMTKLQEFDPINAGGCSEPRSTGGIGQSDVPISLWQGNRRVAGQLVGEEQHGRVKRLAASPIF